MIDAFVSLELDAHARPKEMPTTATLFVGVQDERGAVSGARRVAARFPAHRTR